MKERSLTFELRDVEVPIVLAGAAEQCDFTELMSSGWLATRAYLKHLSGEPITDSDRYTLAWMAARFIQAANETAKANPAPRAFTLIPGVGGPPSIGS